MSVILWKILIVSIFLVQTVIAASLAWYMFRLRQRVNLLQINRNEVEEERRKLSDRLRLKGIEMDKTNKERPDLSDHEKTMLIAALNMPEYAKAITEPKTSFQVRKVYRDLKEKIKESLKD